MNLWTFRLLLLAAIALDYWRSSSRTHTSRRSAAVNRLHVSSKITRLPILSKRLNILHREIQNERAPRPSPTITLDAADKVLAIKVDLDHRAVAAITGHSFGFS
jgi:hypothetical protein